MRIWSHRRDSRVADVGHGFIVTESPAFQSGICDALRPVEVRSAPVAAEVTFTDGAEGRIVVVWRNRDLGFVPESHRAALRAQLDGAGRPELVAPATVYQDGHWWRVWVGPRPEGDLPVPEAGYDQLRPSAPTVCGVPLRQPGLRPR